MTLNILRRGGLLASALLLAAATPALAIQRTFVASTGLDTNPCTLAAPCRGFAAAIALTDPGGEVVVLDSAGYGTVTITKSVSIVAPQGVYGGITAFSGNAITVAAGASDVVTLRGLRLNGLGATNGIQVDSVGQLHVAGTEIAGFGGRGINFAAPGRLFLDDSIVRNNFEAGVHVQTAADLALASIDRSRFENNTLNGVVIATNAQGAITNSVAAHNGSVGFLVDAGGRASISDCRISRDAGDYAVLVRGNGSDATVSRCDVFGSFYGIRVEGTGARLMATDTTVHSPSVGFWAAGGAVAILERCAVSRSGQTSYVADGTGSRMYVSNSVATHSGSCGFNAQFGGTLFTRGNNTVVENAFSCAGTAFNPL